MFIATRREVSATGLRVTRPGKTGPATIDIGGDGLGFYIMLDTPADCDEVIRAAVEAKQLLDPPAEPAPAETVAALAASIADGTPLLVTDDEAGPESCGSTAPITGRPCDLDAGHSGMHAHALACWSRDEVTA